MSTEPTPEHIDAVARVEVARRSCYDDCTDCAPGCWCDCLQCHARAILTSTDPAVHAAMLDALVRAGVLPDVDALRHHLAIAEADASHLAATIRDARESLARNRGRGVGWEKVSQALRPVGLPDALARAERRGRMHTVSAQPNPRFGQVAP